MIAPTLENPATTISAAKTSPIVLASASVARSALLRSAGVPVIIDAAAIDETEVKASLRATRAGAAVIAETLAELKAQQVSRRRSAAFVIGADQVLECEGVVFDKPADLGDARHQLRALRGRQHQLLSAVVVVCDGQRLWHYVDRASLAMRDFSDFFLDGYLQAMGRDALSTVGGYYLEGIGAQLFADVDGDYFSILGLPLLPLLQVLREHGLLPS